jgi:arabinogalactan endo-1,4-beta-galactosidase
MMITETQTGFPQLNCCNGHWTELGEIINAGISAVRDAGSDIQPKPLVVLHVADPKNLVWWFGNIIREGKVTDFDVIGFSYYPLWHTEVAYNNLAALVSEVRNHFDKKIMILETAYPWTTEGSDNYTNRFGSQAQVGSFSYTQDGQKAFLIDLTQKMITAGAIGIVYWEPAWISSQMKDLWGTGSSWENSTLFDFKGNVLPSFAYMTYPYKFIN